MSLPIIEQIAVELKATLETITAANDYDVEVSEVIRPRRTGVPQVPDSYGIILLGGDEEPGGHDLIGNPGARSWRHTFTMELFIRVSEHDETPIDTLVNVFACEVERAVMVDATRGGLAIDTRRMGRMFAPPGDGLESVTLIFEVNYRVSEVDARTRV